VLEQITQAAEKGELKIVTSIISKAEVAYLRGSDLLPLEQEQRIIDFFENDYLVVMPLDDWVCDEARRLTRAFHGCGLRSPDYVHAATAVFHRVPLLQAYDRRILDLNGRIEGLRIELPAYEGDFSLPFDDEGQD
jgi:predicted nucleic acid-binding protein